jgi:hypothetical protein
MRLVLEMSLEREEFLRLLPGAVGDYTVGEDGVMRGSTGDGHWTLRLEPMPERPLGRLFLTRHRLDLRLEGCTPAEADAFMARFHRGFLRGGG